VLGDLRLPPVNAEVLNGQSGKEMHMPILILKGFLALATGAVGGYMHRSLGVAWGVLLMAGYFLGFWLWSYLKQAV
jgi:hypothetical protein